MELFFRNHVEKTVEILKVLEEINHQARILYSVIFSSINERKIKTFLDQPTNKKPCRSLCSARADPPNLACIKSQDFCTHGICCN